MLLLDIEKYKVSQLADEVDCGTAILITDYPNPREAVSRFST
jgi:hypothetical protein